MENNTLGAHKERLYNFHRRSIRLKGYDYSQNGAYFITICNQNRECLFGEIIGQKMILNDVGKMIDYQWNELQNKFNNIQLDEYIVMPNHFHGIIIGKIIGAFKSITTHEYIKGVKKYNWPSFNNAIWQRNYYEHIIRHEESLNKIREYIINNPMNWINDEMYQ